MAVQRPSLDTAVSNWQQRAQQYSQLGIPQQAYHQIAQQDITNVANNGSTPMTTAEVNAAMLAQVAHTSVIGNQVPHPTSFMGDVSTAIGSVSKDIGGLLSGLIPGTVNFVHHLPSELTNTSELISHLSDDQWLQQHSYEPADNFSGLLRDLAKSPILSLAPGLSDVADLTSAAGRQYLLTHPVTAALDVAPYGIGAAGRVARMADLGEAGSALEALQANQPARAAVRGLRDLAAKIPGGANLRLLQRAYYQDIANQLGVSQLYRNEVFRPYSTIARKFSAKLVSVVKDIGDQVWQMDPAERAQFFQENLNPDSDNIDPRHQAMMDHLREVQTEITDMGKTRYERTGGKEGLLTIPHGRGNMVFSADTKINKFTQAADRLSLKKAEIWRKRTAELHKLNDLDQRLFDATAPDHIASLRRSIAIHKRNLVDEEMRYERYDNLLHERQEQLHDAIIRTGGPAAAHPLVDQTARDRFKQIATAQHSAIRQIQRRALMRPTSKRFNPELYHQRQVLQLQQLQTNLRTIDEATHFDEIKSAIMGPMYRKKPLNLPSPEEEGIEPKEAKARAKTIAQAEKKQARDEKKYNAQTRAHAQQLYDDTMRSVVTSVLDLVAHGYDPIWMKHIEPGEEEAKAALGVVPFPDRIENVTQYMGKAFNFAPRAQDVALGLVAGARELFRDQATQEFVLPLINRHGMSRQALQADFKTLARKEHALTVQNPSSRSVIWSRSVAGHAQALMSREWRAIDPARWGVSHGATRFSRRDQIMIPKALADNLDRMMPKVANGEHRLPLVSDAYDKAMHVFRFSVLTGPRHLVHVAVAGLLPLMMREPGALPRLISSWRLIHEGGAPIDLTKHLYTYSTDQIYNYAVGHQFGSWAKKAWMQSGFKVAERLARIEEMASDIYRVSAFLSAKARGIDERNAITLANKVAVDMDDMAPWERTVIKQVFPFYAFTRFLFRYLLSYPADHPYRVSILSRFSTQENEEWNTLLPNKFMQMLWVGKPDANGNILTIDYKNLNPFRSFSNDYTMVGFFQSLNPIVSAAYAARGFSTLTGVGDLYPQVEFNPQSGSLQAAPPSGKDQVMNALEQIVPELGALDHFVGITDQMRLLKRQNPQAYRSLLFSQLNIPLAPVTVNKPYVEEHTEINRYKAAQSAVSQAEKTNQWGGAEQFANVPFMGTYISPEKLAAYWQSLLAQLKRAGISGVDPRALMATPIHRTSPNPLELLGGGKLTTQQSTLGM